jgi:hypothetical protein
MIFRQQLKNINRFHIHMEIKGVNIMDKNLNKLVVSGLMAAAVFGLGFGNQAAVQAAAFDQATTSLAHVMSTGSNQSNATDPSDGQNAPTSVAHVMSTGSNQSNASNGSEGENTSLSPAHSMSLGSNDSND